MRRKYDSDTLYGQKSTNFTPACWNELIDSNFSKQPDDMYAVLIFSSHVAINEPLEYPMLHSETEKGEHIGAIRQNVVS